MRWAMIARIPDKGTSVSEVTGSTDVGVAGAVATATGDTGVSGAVWVVTAPAAAAWTSSFVTRPRGPVPEIPARLTPSSSGNVAPTGVALGTAAT